MSLLSSGETVTSVVSLSPALPKKQKNYKMKKKAEQVEEPPEIPAKGRSGASLSIYCVKDLIYNKSLSYPFNLLITSPMFYFPAPIADRLRKPKLLKPQPRKIILVSSPMMANPHPFFTSNWISLEEPNSKEPSISLP